MKQYKDTYPITMMAKLLKVSVSRFYEWLKSGLSQKQIRRNQQTIMVKIAHQETNESYGYIRLSKHLHAQGVQISQYAVRTIKKVNKLWQDIVEEVLVLKRKNHSCATIKIWFTY